MRFRNRKPRQLSGGTAPLGRAPRWRPAPGRIAWLTHYSPMITDPEADLPQAQSIFPAAVCGADGMQITLQYEEA